MTTLTTHPVAPLLDRLFEQSAAVRFSEIPGMAQLPHEERERLMRSETEYLNLYHRLKDVPLPVSRDTGTLLYMLARSNGARNIVEFGTSFGISTIYLASALRDNGGGQLITSEFEICKLARARANLEAAGLLDLVQLRAGDALETLSINLPEQVDMLLLDGAKALYPEILDLVQPCLRPGALVIADNTSYSPEYLARVRSATGGYMSTVLEDDVELSVWLG